MADDVNLAGRAGVDVDISGTIADVERRRAGDGEGAVKVAVGGKGNGCKCDGGQQEYGKTQGSPPVES